MQPCTHLILKPTMSKVLKQMREVNSSKWRRVQVIFISRTVETLLMLKNPN
jgi:hypothetical protein